MHELTGLAAVGMSLAIPIIVVIAVAIRKIKVSQMLHQERMAAIEKGLPLPSSQDYALASQKTALTPRDNLRRGLLWAFVGIGLVVSFRFSAFGIWGDRHRGDTGTFLAFGIICLCVGAAYLIFYFIESRKPNPPQS